MATTETQVRKMIDDARKKGGIQKRVLEGWELQISYRAPKTPLNPFHKGIWHVSLMLYPYGRGSTEEDWGVHGKLVAMSGCPDPIECCLTPPETTDPNAAHHYTWGSDGKSLKEHGIGPQHAAVGKKLAEAVLDQMHKQGGKPS